MRYIARQALDNGARGIVMPHVDGTAEVREVVNRLKYPPVGHRSMLHRSGARQVDHCRLGRVVRGIGHTRVADTSDRGHVDD